MVELHSPEVGHHHAEPRLGLAGEAGHYRGPESDVRYDVPQELRRGERIVYRRLAVHLREDLGNGVLQWDVDVAHGVRRGEHPDEEVLRNLARIRVQDAHPEVAGYPVDRAQEVGESLPLLAPQHRILRDHVELAASARDESARLPEDRAHRTRAVLSADEGDCAVCAAVRAALGYLEVREGLAGEAERRHPGLDPVLLHSAPLVDSRKRPLQLGVALRIASGDDHPAVVAALLELHGAEDFGLRLLARRLDERARVDDHNVRPVRIGRKGPPLLEEVPRHDLEVDRVLRAAERHKRYRLPGHAVPLSRGYFAGRRIMFLKSASEWSPWR